MKSLVLAALLISSSAFAQTKVFCFQTSEGQGQISYSEETVGVRMNFVGAPIERGTVQNLRGNVKFDAFTAVFPTHSIEVEVTQNNVTIGYGVFPRVTCDLRL